MNPEIQQAVASYRDAMGDLTRELVAIPTESSGKPVP
jgi:hypothetical protein